MTNANDNTKNKVLLVWDKKTGQFKRYLLIRALKDLNPNEESYFKSINLDSYY